MSSSFAKTARRSKAMPPIVPPVKTKYNLSPRDAQSLSRMLQINPEDLTIVDQAETTYGRLALVSWVPTDKPTPYLRSLKGLIVYFGPTPETDRILLTPYIHQSVVMASSIPEDETIVIPAQDAETPRQRYENMVMLPAFDGVVVTLFTFEGVAYFATTNKLSAIHSYHGGPTSLYTLFLQLGGQPLTDPDLNLTILVVHPQLSHGTKNTSAAGLYLKSFSHSKGEEAIIPAWVRVMVPMTNNQANAWLQQGLLLRPEEDVTISPTTGDERLGDGEAVLFFDLDTGNSVVVESPAYAWRDELRRGGTDFAVTLTRMYAAVAPMEPAVYANLWPILTPGTELTSWGRFYNSYLCLRQAVPVTLATAVDEAMSSVFGYAPDDNYAISPVEVTYRTAELGGNVKGRLPLAIAFVAGLYPNYARGMPLPSGVTGRTESVLSALKQARPADALDYLTRAIYQPSTDTLLNADQLVGMIADFKQYRRKTAERSATSSRQ